MATTISFPTAVTTNSANWNNTFADDGNNTTHPFIGWGSHSDIELSSFSSLSIPTGSTINGIEIVVEGSSNSNPNTPDFSVYNGSSWSSAQNSNIAPWSKFYATYDPAWGGSSDLWGLSWTPSTAEGIKVKMDSSTITSGRRIFLDWLKVRITYTAPSGYGNTVNGVATANIGKVNGVATANIDKVNGT
jgi:hypothetical protein